MDCEMGKRGMKGWGEGEGAGAGAGVVLAAGTAKGSGRVPLSERKTGLSGSWNRFKVDHKSKASGWMAI